jgi:hypothetical protein
MMVMFFSRSWGFLAVLGVMGGSLIRGVGRLLA